MIPGVCLRNKSASALHMHHAAADFSRHQTISLCSSGLFTPLDSLKKNVGLKHYVVTFPWADDLCVPRPPLPALQMPSMSC